MGTALENGRRKSRGWVAIVPLREKQNWGDFRRNHGGIFSKGVDALQKPQRFREPRMGFRTIREPRALTRAPQDNKTRPCVCSLIKMSDTARVSSHVTGAHTCTTINSSIIVHSTRRRSPASVDRVHPPSLRRHVFLSNSREGFYIKARRGFPMNISSSRPEYLVLGLSLKKTNYMEIYRVKELYKQGPLFSDHVENKTRKLELFSPFF